MFTCSMSLSSLISTTFVMHVTSRRGDTPFALHLKMTRCSGRRACSCGSGWLSGPRVEGLRYMTWEGTKGARCGGMVASMAVVYGSGTGTKAAGSSAHRWEGWSRRGP